MTQKEIAYICALALFFMSFSNVVLADKSNDRFDFKLSQHSRDKNLIGKPALLQYTDSEGGESSYLIDAALKGIYAPSESDLEFAGFFEAHKNTLVKKEQDTQTVGIIASTYLAKGGCSNVLVGSGNVRLCTDNLLGDLSIGYQLDNEKNTESIQLVSELSGTLADYYINNVSPTSNFPAYWSPTIGIEYENFLEADNNQEGDLFRAYGNLEFGIYPFFTELDGRLSVALSYSHWEDFSKDASLGISDDSHILKKAILAYLITQRDNKLEVSITLGWVDGEDPRNKKPDQEYTQVGIGIKY